MNNDVRNIVINDLDLSIYSFWYCVIHHTDELIHKIETTSITIEEWHIQKQVQNNKQGSELIALAFSTLFLNRTNRSGIIKAGAIGGKSQNGNYKIDCRFNKEKIIEKIRNIASKGEKIEIYNQDTKYFIKDVIENSSHSFTFFDPPYYEKGPSLYTNFYKHVDHKELADTIQSLLYNHAWIVTYDNSDEIKRIYEKLPYIEYYLSYSANKKTKGIEYMFFSPSTLPVDPDNFLSLCL